MTMQRFSKRISEHKSTCNRIDAKKSTALTEHHFETGHKFKFDTASIVEIENNYEKRKIAEVIHIILNEDIAVNNKRDTENFSSSYSNLLDNYKSIRNIRYNP
jgi:hypothetical protein